jgi:hypothetical protein
MILSSVRLQLLIGPQVALPAPYEVVDALIELEVTSNDRERDGFQMDFTLGRDSPMDYGLLRNGYLDPPARVIIVVTVGVVTQVLADGIVTDHQVVPSNKPGESVLRVTGQDIGLRLDLDDKYETYPNQSDSSIVTTILASYATYGLVPDVEATTDVPTQNDRITTQRGKDLDFIRQLASRNGFVFYIEPTQVPGVNTAYWGPENREGRRQPPLSMNMGPETNVDTPINFRFNALGPTKPQVTVVEPLTRAQIPIPAPSDLLPSLSGRPATPLRTTIPHDTANLSPAQAMLRALSTSSESSDAITATGELNTVSYGRALQSRRLVGVRGAGSSYDGDYYVQQVKHRIKRGEYKQNFTLLREGRGAASSRVTL